MSDEHRADVTGYEGDGVVRTPTLDELSRTGVTFRNAYTPSPICIPARQSLMAGQLPSTTGCVRYGQDLPPSSMTFARRLAQYGYRTVCSGKLHHFGPDQMQGWTRRLAPDAEVADHFIDGADTESFARGTPAPGTGKRTNQVEIERAAVGRGPWQRFDENAVDAAVEFIEDYFADPYYDRPGAQRPLLLKVSLIQPHYPFLTDEERFVYYLNRVPVYLDERFDHPKLGQTQTGPNVETSERNLRRATAAYYGMVDQVDTHFTRVLEALRRVGQDPDDWIIVYTTDHGEMLGEHGIWEKTQFFEGSARVPLIIRSPRHARPHVVTENVSMCDLFATLCDMAEVPLPRPADTVGGRGLDSRSLLRLMNGDAASWADEAVSEFAGRHVMIKQGTLKYAFYGPELPETLFDLAIDPGERRNVFGEAQHEAAVTELRRRRDELGFAGDQP